MLTVTLTSPDRVCRWTFVAFHSQSLSLYCTAYLLKALKSWMTRAEGDLLIDLKRNTLRELRDCLERKRQNKEKLRQRQRGERVITTLTAVRMFILELCRSWHPTELDTVRRRASECRWTRDKREEEEEEERGGGLLLKVWRRRN